MMNEGWIALCEYTRTHTPYRFIFVRVCIRVQSSRDGSDGRMMVGLFGAAGGLLLERNSVVVIHGTEDNAHFH